jgi:molybdenum cofactor synthesis domain-containing protein
MTSFDSALETVLSFCKPLAMQDLATQAAASLVLTGDVLASADSPRFDNSAVDGFAVRTAEVSDASRDSPVLLNLRGEIAAGGKPNYMLGPGETLRVLTGAPIPPGIDAIVMQEDCEEVDGWVNVMKSAAPGDNIRRRGEEFEEGALLAAGGSRLTPPLIGQLASNGTATVRVFRQPRVATVITGNELVAPGQNLSESQIYESNGAMIGAAAEMIGASITGRTVVGDEPTATAQAIRKSLQLCDVLITCGGVSVGAHDVVKDALADCGIQTHVWQVAMKPGKPFFFGTVKSTGQLVFGLPGNPVSAMITFQLFVRPALLTMSGQTEVGLPMGRARLRGIVRAADDRDEFVRGVLSYEGATVVVTPTSGQGSHMLAGLSSANVLFRLAAGATVAEGDEVEVAPLQWNP